MASSPSTYSVSSGNSDSSSKSLSILSLCCSETVLEEGGPKQAGNSNTCLYKPVDLPADFELPNKFGKKIDQTLKECKKPGSVPPDVMKRVVRQVADHIEVENLSHPKRPLSGLPGLTA